MDRTPVLVRTLVKGESRGAANTSQDMRCLQHQTRLKPTNRPRVLLASTVTLGSSTRCKPNSIPREPPCRMPHSRHRCTPAALMKKNTTHIASANVETPHPTLPGIRAKSWPDCCREMDHHEAQVKVCWFFFVGIKEQCSPSSVAPPRTHHTTNTSASTQMDTSELSHGSTTMLSRVSS